MRYLGGKEKIAKIICDYLESVRKPNQLFVDLTVGGASIISKMSSPKVAYDIHKPLIHLYNALSSGHIELPDTVSELQYHSAKSYEDSDPIKAFIGFGCSFSGKYFAGYAKSSNRNYAKNAKNSLIKKFKTLKGVNFECQSLFDYVGSGNLIYIDPPYIGTTKYSINFDYDLFWDKVRELSINNDVYISEYTAPNDFKCVLQMEKIRGLRNSKGEQIKTLEKLWRLVC